MQFVFLSTIVLMGDASKTITAQKENISGGLIFALICGNISYPRMN